MENGRFLDKMTFHMFLSCMYCIFLSQIYKFELSRIKERQAEGIAKAKKKGRFVGISDGSSKSIEVFINKESTKKILKYLREK